MSLTHATCRRCGRETIGGWSGTGQLLSVQTTVDADPLTPEQELRVLVAGCWTWTLYTVAAQLHPRSARIIRQRPAGTRPRQTVHADHQCTPWRNRA